MAIIRMPQPLEVSGTLDTSPLAFQLDSFGRQRVSQLTTQIDLKQTVDNLPLFINQVTNGTGLANYVSSDSLTEMTTNAAGDYVIAQTKQSVNYQSGKNIVTFQTFDSFEAETNIIKRIGLYNSDTVGNYDTGFDGFFMESSGGDISVNVYKNGSPLVPPVTQANWNIDNLDGSGDSGITIDWSKSQTLVVDFEWLGVGGIRWGVIVGNITYYFHMSTHANIITGVYTKSPNKPLRWEIRQTGAGSGVFRYISASVATEGAINNVGKVLSVNSGSSFVNANVVGVRYAVLGLRLKATNLNTVVNLINTSTLASTSDDWLWELRLNPNVLGAFVYSGLSNSSLETASGATANIVTGGTLISSGYGAASFAGGKVQSRLENALKLGSNIDGTVDEIVLSAMPLSPNLDIFGSITWRELE